MPNPNIIKDRPQKRLTPLLLWGVILLTIIMGACANIGTPGGGPRDESAPILVKATPAQGATDVNRTRITLDFDELVTVRDAFSNVVVSPSIGQTPRVSSLGRRITIDFDSLAPNTTYTIDFGNAIEDNNEGNKLQGFTYTFSTGPEIDTLRISGRVLNARDLEPRKGVLVGVHTNLNDTAFTGARLLRVARTDDSGRFTIRGLAPGKYRVFALDDKDGDLRYSQPEEDMAFFESIVEPYSQPAVAIDTIWNPLTGLVDNIRERARTRFFPNDLLLSMFNSGKKPQYLLKYERQDSTRLFFKFNAAAESLPSLDVAGFPALSSLGVIEASEKKDSVVVWLRKDLVAMDSLPVITRYLRTEEGGNRLVEGTDTLMFVTNRPKVSKKKSNSRKRISAADSIAACTVQFKMVGGSDSRDVFAPIYFESVRPVKDFDLSKVHLLVQKDSIFTPIKEGWSVSLPDSLQPRRYMVEYPWDYGATYQLAIDSLAATDLMGLPSQGLEQMFSIKKEQDYSSMTFHITGLDADTPAFVELLGGSDKVVRTVPVAQNTALFQWLSPGRYYARVVIDANNNGIYDTGDYDALLQPEQAYYYPKTINLKKLWNKEETWDIFSTPVDKMKPYAILKNKPDEDKRRNSSGNKNRDEEEEEDY